MELPAFPEVSAETWRAMAARHKLGLPKLVRLPQVGTFNEIYGVGEHLILRVPRNAPRFTGATLNEAIAVPLARAAGVRTPAIVAFDDKCDLLPVPYAIYHRVAGGILEHAVKDHVGVSTVWREVGRDLAKLHAGVARTSSVPELRTFEDKTDPRPLPQAIAQAGYIGPIDAEWLDLWLERLAPYALGKNPQRFLHGDTQSANVMVTPSSMRYAAIIDWGGCRWGDPALDFAGVPMLAVPPMLAGYRETAPEEGEALEARILWRQLTIGLHQLRGRPQPDLSWGERPLGVLLDALAFFGSNPGGNWSRWAPHRPIATGRR